MYGVLTIACLFVSNFILSIGIEAVSMIVGDGCCVQFRFRDGMSDDVRAVRVGVTEKRVLGLDVGFRFRLTMAAWP